MKQIVSPLAPFPNISWWSLADSAGVVLFDEAEYFEKMTYRNKYFITGANGSISLSIPLNKGRNQRTVMSEVVIDNTERWQTQHWRTLFSVYGRAPFFEHYAPELEAFYKKEYRYLTEFNIATIQWVKEQLGLKYEEQITGTYKKEYEENIVDIRPGFKPKVEKHPLEEKDALYYQMFMERNGFYPNLSILDLLLTEGPATITILRDNEKQLADWLA